MIYFAIILALIGLDQILKHLIQTTMEWNATIPLLPNFFHISYIQNTGAAFSFFRGQQLLLISITSVVSVFLLIYLWRKRRAGHGIFLTSITLIVSGGIGNLIDRIRLGYVVDYLDFRFFPVFNLADICVVTGSLLMLLYLFWIEPKQNGSGGSHGRS